MEIWYKERLILTRDLVLHKKIKKDKENWDIVKDTHEPIINKDVWEKVHQLRMKSFIKVSIKEKEKSLFAGKLKCADCGYAMRRQYRKNSKDKITFNCSTYYQGQKTFVKIITLLKIY